MLPQIQEDTLEERFRIRYTKILCDVPDLDDILDNISEKGWLIISVFYTTDTNQVCLICKGEETETERLIKELKQVSKE